MNDESQSVEATTEASAEHAPEQATEQATAPVTEPTTDATEPTAMSGREEAAEFVAKFGDKGAVWYAEGLSIDDAATRQVAELRNEISELKTKLAARPLAGEETPVSFDAADKKVRNGFASKIHVK